MKILVLTPYVAWPLDHGGRLRTWHLLRALAREHSVVNVAVARSPKHRDDAHELEKRAGIAQLVRQAAESTQFDLAVIDSLWRHVYRPSVGAIPYVASSHNVESDVLRDAARHETGLRRRLA